MAYTSLEEAYQDITLKLKYKNIKTSEYKKINYGIQFKVSADTIRIFESKKKGITIDKSQIKSNETFLIINSILQDNISSNINNNTEILSPPLTGSDEVGKGDYFAPLIVCALYADKKQYALLETIGVKDSKLLEDKKIIALSKEIEKICPNKKILKIGQKKYNELYSKMKNINIILSWAHCTAIKDVYSQVEFKNLLIDKFGRETQIKTNLSELNLDNIIFETKAERNLAVAAASILARATLLKHMQEQNKKYNMEFPLGANNIVVSKGKEFIKKYSFEELSNVAKLHFKTTEDIK